jgi:PGF-pre-PGF domain-containing protein
LVLVLVLDKAASKWAFSGLTLVFALIAVGIYFSGPTAPTAAALTGPGCGGGPPEWGDWDMVANGGISCRCQDEDVTVNGDVIVHSMDFKMSNCTIRINSSYEGQYGISIGAEAVAMDTNFIMDNNSLITYGANDSAKFRFNTTTSPDAPLVVVMNKSTIRGAGFSSTRMMNTGVYLYATNVTIANMTIRNGYNGIILNGTNVNVIRNSTVSNNANIGILVHKSNFTNITNSTIRNNGGLGIYVNVSNNVTIYGNNVVNNSRDGIYTRRSDTLNITSNYVYLNRGNGITNNFSSTYFQIWNNIILNNTGWSVWTNETGVSTTTQSTIYGNTMCYNGNTTYWAFGNVAYYAPTPGVGHVPDYNNFCINVSRPIKGGCTNADAVTFYVSGNPLSNCAGCNAPTYNGKTNCTLSIDNVEKNFTNPLVYAADETITLTFDGTSIGDGHHNLTVYCDPPDYNPSNLALANSDYDRDTAGPGYSSGGKIGDCDGVTLAVYWTDGTCNVSYATLSTNETGGYLNKTTNYSSPAVIEWNQSWSNFSWWNASMENAQINWLVWANDSAGNWNKTDNTTFKAEKCTVSTVTGGGGGGGGGGAAGAPSDCSSYKGNMTITAILSARTVSCRPQTDFTLFNLTFSSPLAMTSKIILEEAGQPAVQNPTPAVYKFYRLTALNITDSYLSKAITEFSVPKDWMAKNNVVASAVNLYRLAGKDWEVQLTIPLSGTSNTSTFRSTLTSVETATFAIAAGKACSGCPASSDWSACVDGKRSKTEWTCSVETDYACQNFTTTGKCSCGLCPSATDGVCVNGRLNRTVYSCSADTGYSCAGKTELVSCPPLQLLLPFFEDLKSAPLAVQVAVAAVTAAVLGGGGFAAYRFLKLRKAPAKAFNKPAPKSAAKKAPKK